ncbi:shikimate O-hydroxycinnamoyltransferase-like [Senna tora]|uniref:Shikimate O-hydroxycinnamoyltransferase-like n=1 Tax=Senna tora TaxID=362788 RepID=A0A834WWG1_9FABA|nr:shikimate O-hydroxycinnamoyltransferase-like [Senna tora]
MATNSASEPGIRCNNRGVDFVEATADVELRGLNLYNPDECVEGKLVPHKKHGVLAVQVTFLKCGGLVVGCTFDHRIADAYSANMFLVSWAAMAQPTKPKPIFSTFPSQAQPCFDRSLLSPRRPGFIQPSLHDMYIPYSNLPPPKKLESQSDPLISRIYYVTAKTLNHIQSFANSDSNAILNGVKRTKLESFCAFLWKMVASSSKGKKSVEELTEKPLSWVAGEVHAFLEAAVTKDHFLGLIDWVEAHRPSAGFPVAKVDFGWGKPLFGSYHFPWGGDSGYVMPMPSTVGNGDWVVYMHLRKGQLEKIECEAAHVFKPLTWEYLNLII